MVISPRLDGQAIEHIDQTNETTVNLLTQFDALATVKVLRHVYASKANAERAARNEWRRLQRGIATFAITLAIGRPEVFPDLPASVSGWKPAIDNTAWIITRATHTLNDNGLGTVLEFEIKATEVVD